MDDEVFQLDLFINEKLLSGTSAVRYKTALKWWRKYSLQYQTQYLLYESVLPTTELDDFQKKVMQLMKNELSSGKISGLRNTCLIAFLQGTGMALERTLRLGVYPYRWGSERGAVLALRNEIVPISYSAFLALEIWESVFPFKAFEAFKSKNQSRYLARILPRPLWPGSLAKERWGSVSMRRHTAANLFNKMSQDAGFSVTITPGSLRDYFYEKAGYIPNDTFKPRRMESDEQLTEPLDISMIEHNYFMSQFLLERLEAVHQVPGIWTTGEGNLFFINGERITFQKTLYEAVKTLGYDPEADRMERHSSS